MKIVYFIDNLRGDGTQQAVRQLAEGLAPRGHEQTVVCLNDSWDEALVVSLRRIPTEIRVVGKAALASGYGLVSTWRWLRDQRFDVAVTMLFASDVIGRVLARLGRVPRIISSLRARNMHYSLLQRWLVRATIGSTDGVVINSSYLRDFAIIEEGASPDRIYVIPNGVCVEDYAKPIDQGLLRTEFGISLGGWLVGSMGRLTRQKGFDVLLHALSLLPSRDIHLLLIGTGNQERELRALAANLGLQNQVHFTGYRRDVARILGALDLYVHAARFEGMPNAILEAMAARCPIVATAVDGTCDLIQDGVHGWLVPVENARALTDAIQGALSSPIDRQHRAAAAQQRVATQFSVGAMVAAWEKVLMDRS